MAVATDKEGREIIFFCPECKYKMNYRSGAWECDKCYNRWLTTRLLPKPEHDDLVEKANAAYGPRRRR